MPGIAGIITKMPRERAVAELQRMLGTMRHESFYRSGIWTDEALGLYVGQVEHEDAWDGTIPVRNESGDKLLVFSGDEFPEPDMEAQLKNRGHAVTGGGRDYLVHQAEEDPSFPACLNGQFQGVFADRSSGVVTLFNDPWGLRRIYYHQAPDAFYFAAEAKAILAVKRELRSVDARSLGEYIACGCVLEERSLFKDIYTFPYASAWTFRNGELASREQYRHPAEWEEQERLPAAEYYERVREVFSRKLTRYFAGSRRVALSLTGGLDTRMILAWHKPEPESLPCYTFGSTYRECRDVQIGRRVARLLGQPHTVLPVGQEFLADFARYAERTVYLTDGCANVRHAPDLYVNEAARVVAPVRMTGNYGDQVLRQMIVLRAFAPEAGIFTPEVMAQASAALQTYDHLVQGNALTLATTHQTAYHYYGLLALESSQVCVRTPYLDTELVRLLYRAPDSVLHDNGLRVQLIRDGSPVLARIRTDLGYAGRGGELVGELNQKFHLFTMRLEYACEHGNPRWLTHIDRALLGRQIEKNFVGLHKFTHFCLWYRNELKEYVREMLLDERTRTRPYLTGNVLEKMVEEHVSGAENHTTAISRILSLEYLHRTLVDA